MIRLFRLRRAADARGSAVTSGLSCFALAFACGCSSSTATDANGAGGHTSPDGGTAPGAVTLVFEPAGPLQLVPGEQRTLRLRATPAGAYHLRFALLGAPKDASLDRSETVTLDDGTAAALLTASTSPTLFALRASAANAASAEMGVGVSAGGFATLTVKPVYSGSRPVSYWVASVRQGAHCADLSGSPPPDGALIGQAVVNQLPRIEGIPIGVQLALTLRAGYFAYGCTTLGSLVPDQTNTVQLAVNDLPLQLAGTNLDLGLGVKTGASEFLPVLRQGIDDALTALRAGAEDDVDALLDAMRAEIHLDADVTAFDSARSTKGWDAAVRKALGTSAATALRTPAEAWMKQGISELSSANTFRGTLNVPNSTTAAVELRTVANLDAVEAGFSRSNALSVTAKAGDTVLLGANQAKTVDLRWQWWPSRLLAALAKRPATTAVSGTESVPVALAEKLSCTKIASTLVLAGTQPAKAFGSYDANAVEALCRSALGTLWQRAQNGSSRLGTSGTLSVSASSTATVDEHARAIRLSGTWLGTLTTSSGSTSVNGEVHAQLPNGIE